ncbi:MAG TPA: SUMF1/EgtB/PvdO family nonheme iron enzyme [Pirellulales bacterium]|jgi:formylglycine-generating enzyme required for sulfatase activity|nr:SUMF1/EgtB/PvdO family nonheme iron enzyme [Pirellulales bacterium]
MPVSLEQFVEAVADARLMSADELSQLIDSLPPGKRGDLQQVAQELVKRGHLSREQATSIYRTISAPTSETTRLNAAAQATQRGLKTDVSDSTTDVADEPSRAQQVMPWIAVGVAAVLVVAAGIFALTRSKPEASEPVAASPAPAAAKPEAATPAGTAKENESPERSAVAWVLAQKGSVLVRPQGIDSTLKITPSGHLPDRPVTVLGVTITDAGKIADGRLEKLIGLDNLESLDLHNTSVADKGLADIAGVTSLKSLSLAGTAVTDAGLGHLALLQHLESLNLEGLKKVTDAGASELSQLKGLKSLVLTGTGMTDKGVASAVAALPQCKVTHGFNAAAVAALAAKATELAAAPAASTTVATASAKPAAMYPPVKPGDTIDLIKQLKPARDVLAGVVSVDAGHLTIDGQEKGARVKLPVSLADHYTLTIVAERVKGTEPLAVQLKVGQANVLAYLGADGNKTNGLDTVDRIDYDRNESGWNVPAFHDSGPTTFVVQVDKSHVRVMRDDVVLIDWHGDAKRLAIDPKRNAIGFDPRGVGLFVPPGAESRIEKLELSVSKSPITFSPLPVLAAQPVSFSPGVPIDLLRMLDLNRDTVAGQWQFDGAGLVSSEQAPSQIIIPLTPPAEYALVVEAERLDSNEFVIGFIIDGIQSGVTPDFRGRAGFQQLDRKNADVASTRKSTLFKDRMRHTMVCTVRSGNPGRVQLTADGIPLADTSSSTTSFSAVRRLGMAPELRVPNRHTLFLATYGRCRFTRYDLIPLNEDTFVGPLSARSQVAIPDTRLALPSDDAEQAARKNLHEEQRSEFGKARQPAEKIQLARQLYANSFKPQKELATRVALLAEARDLAAEAGEPYVVSSIIDALAQAYRVDNDDTQLEVLPKISNKQRLPLANHDLADLAMALAEHLASIDRHEDAKRMSDVAVTAARKSQEAALVKHTSDRAKRLTALKLAFEAVEKAEEKLKSDPSDGDANLVVGRYRAFDRGDLAGGMPYLARSSDAALAELAKRSLATGYQAEPMLQLADAWFDAAATEAKPKDRSESKDRSDWLLAARFWYRHAIPSQVGALRDNAIKRLDEITARRSNEKSPAGALELPIARGVTMRFRLIPAGEFTMGTLESKDRSVISHQVRITKPFYISTTEVTQAQYYAVMGDNPARPHDGAQYPYYHQNTNADWADADVFCKRLAAYAAFEPYQPRLPTEADWEYAARAGSQGRYFFGDDPALLPSFAWFSLQSPQPVGLLRPNAAGLFDVLGNAAEWCSDWEGKTYYESSPPEDPTGPMTGREHENRGGQFNSSADQCRIWERRPPAMPALPPAVGFRVVLGL